MAEMADKERDEAQPAGPAPLWTAQDIGLALALLFAVLCAYVPALRSGFIWDDDDHFTTNPMMTDPGGLAAIWSSSSAIYYPMTLTVWWVMRRLVGLNPMAYHLVTILFHVANALLLRTWFARMNWKGGWWAAALFALHPVQVESVAWATELKNTLSGFFLLLTALVYLAFHDRREAARPRAWLWHGAAMLLFAAALASKPSTVMLPAALALLLWWRNGWRLPPRRQLLPLAPLFALALAWSLYTIWEQKHHSNAKGPEWDFTLGQRVMLALRAVPFYLGKLLWPNPLIFIYPRWDPAKFDGLVVAGGALLAVGPALLAATWRRRESHAAAFALGFFLLMLFPVMGFFNIYFMRFSFVADHFQYLASMGVLGLVGAALAGAAERGGFRRVLAFCGAGAVLVVYAGLSYQQCFIYANEWTLWNRTLDANPNAAIAHGNLGHIFLEANKLDEAERHLLAATGLSENYWEAYNDFGRLKNLRGAPGEALALFNHSISVWPHYAVAWDNLATTEATLGQMEESVASFQKSLELSPADPVTRCNFAAILLRMNRHAEARQQVEIAAKLDPKDERILAFRDQLRRMAGS